MGKTRRWSQVTGLGWLVLAGCGHGYRHEYKREREHEREPVLARALTGADWEQEAPRRLREATVGVEQQGSVVCAGALAARTDVVVTALHCLDEPHAPGTPVFLVLSDGTRQQGALVAYDVVFDLAVLRLEASARVEPLPLADSDPLQGGERLFFLGRPHRWRQVQRAEVLKRDQCPDLPELKDALFGSFEGYPGDSGAAVVAQGGLVAIIHGGVRCSIAVPSAKLGPLVRQALARP
jgi:hypothetical protein